MYKQNEILKKQIIVKLETSKFKQRPCGYAALCFDMQAQNSRSILKKAYNYLNINIF